MSIPTKSLIEELDDLQAAVDAQMPNPPRELEKRGNELIFLANAAPRLLELVQRMLKHGQFFMSAVEEMNTGEANFEVWKADALAAVSEATGQ